MINIKKINGHLGKRGKISFKSTEYHNNHNADKVETLINDDTDGVTGYGVLVSSNEASHFEFTIYDKCNIWAYGTSYSDSGGNTPDDINLYKKNNDKFEPFLQNVPTQCYKWYLLFENLQPGTYKIITNHNYSQFTGMLRFFLHILYQEIVVIILQLQHFIIIQKLTKD